MTLFPDSEAEQRRRDRRHWRTKLEALGAEIELEPDRVRKVYEVHADRLELVGLAYLWPGTN